MLTSGTWALILLFCMLIAGCVACAGCQYFPPPIYEGHITSRYLKDSDPRHRGRTSGARWAARGRMPILRVVGAWGDTADIRTSMDVYDTYPDIYYRAPADTDSLLEIHRTTLPPNWWQRDTTEVLSVECQPPPSTAHTDTTPPAPVVRWRGTVRVIRQR